MYQWVEWYYESELGDEIFEGKEYFIYEFVGMCLL